MKTRLFALLLAGVLSLTMLVGCNPRDLERKIDSRRNGQHRSSFCGPAIFLCAI